MSHIGVALAYCVLVVLATWPIAGSLTTAIPGSEGDAWVHLWTFRWVRDSLLTGGDVFFTDRMFHPSGVSLTQHNFAWFHIGLWLPLQLLVGEAAAYSIIFLGGFVFTAFTARLFVLELTQSQAAAFIAGLVAGLWPYTLSHHNHPNLIFIGFIPLTLLAVRRLFERATWRQALALAASVAAMGIVRWQQLVFALPLIACYWLAEAVRLRRQPDTLARLGRTTLLTGLALVIALLAMLPLLAPFLSATVDSAVSTQTLDAGELQTGATDLFAYLVPSRYHFIFGAQFEPLVRNFVINREFVAWPGYLTLVLLILGLFVAGRQVVGWYGIASLYVLMALGGSLVVNGTATGIALPWRFLESSLLAVIVRRTDRFNVFLSIPISIAVGVIVAQLLTRLQQRGRKRMGTIAAAGIAVVMLFEYSVDYPLFALETPSWYAQLAEDDSASSVLDVPMNNRTYDEQYIYYQFLHGKALVGGHVSRVPESAFAFIDTVPFLADLWVEPTFAVRDVGTHLNRLADNDIPYLVLHRKFLTDPVLDAWRRWLVVPPIFEDADVVVYATDLSELSLRDVALRGDGGQVALAVVDRRAPYRVRQGESFDVEIAWGSVGGVSAEITTCFQLVQRNTAKSTSLTCHPVANGRAPSDWQAHDLYRDGFMLDVPTTVADGYYQLQLTASDANGLVGEPVNLATIIVAASGHLKDAPAVQNTLAATWASGLELSGFDVNSRAQGIDLTLYWHAASQQTQSLVYFVHLLDADTGELVAQYDTVPQNWQYPTNAWQAGEYVPEQVTFELDSGQYAIQVGVYPVGNAERVPVTDATGSAFEKATVPLTIIDVP